MNKMCYVQLKLNCITKLDMLCYVQLTCFCSCDNAGIWTTAFDAEMHINLTFCLLPIHLSIWDFFSLED